MSENIHHLSGNLLVGSSHFFVDTTNNRVGITTANPDAGLHVNSNAYVHTDFRVGSGIAMNVTGGRITAGSFEGDGSLLENVPGDSGSWVNGSSSNVHLAVSTDNVGIGVLDASYKLDIQFTGDNGLRVKNTATGTSDHSSIYIDSGSGNSYLKFLHSGTNKFTIQGTTSGDMAFRPNGGDHALDIKSNYQTEISSTRTGLTALTNNEATLMISCTDTNAGDDGDIGGGVVFRQRWYNSSGSLVPTGGIYGYKDRGSGSYGGGLIFTYCPDNGSPDNLVEAMRITKEGYVGIGADTPETALHVNGSITLGNTGPINAGGTHTDAQLILGGSHNQGYNRGNYIKLLISGGNNDGSSPYYIMCEDENSYDQFYVKGATSDGGLGRMWVKGEVKMASAGDTFAFEPSNSGWLRLKGAASGQGNIYTQTDQYNNPTHTYTSLAIAKLWAHGSTRFPSDDRIKHFEEEIPNALELIQQLKPYKYKKTTKIYDEDYTGDIGEDWEWEIGLIAQDVEKIPYLEHVVSKPEDSPGDTYGLNYTEFIGVCIQGIKDLSKELNNLKEHTHPDLEERVANHTHPLEPHTHPLEPHTHPLEEHTHPLEPHTHPLEPHTHPLEPHTHPLEEHTHPEIAIEKAKTHELQQRLTLIEHSHAALVARLETLEEKV